MRAAPGNSAGSRAAGVLLAAGVFCLIVVNCRDAAWSRRIVAAAIEAPGQLPVFYQDLEGLFQRRTPSGNVWLRFRGRAEQDAGLMAEIYFFGNYAVYPRRIYVAPAAEVILGNDIATKQGHFDSATARQLGVDWLVTVDLDAEGRLSPAIQGL